jgi:NAD(P)-dependent dehydrogenase (short-subunit alcohol dehydrogenase family)
VEAAEAYRYLMLATYVTGQALWVDGGVSLV